MLRKAIGATFILLLMTQVIPAQQDSGSNPFRPGLHLKDDKPSRTKEQKEYDKAMSPIRAVFLDSIRWAVEPAVK